MTNTDGSSALAIDPARASLFAKMATVMKTVTRVPKEGYNGFHKYKYATADDVADVIREAMGDANLALFVEMGEPRQEVYEYESDGGKKKQTIRTTILFHFTFACGDTGATRTVPWTGQVDDNSDKAVNKCATLAEKYFLMKTFVVSAGDDPDGDGDKQREGAGRKITPKWYEEKRNLDELSSRAFTSGFTKERNGKGIEEIKDLIAPKVWADFETGRDCWLAIKDIVEARRAQQAAPAEDPRSPEDIALQNAITDFVDDKPGKITNQGNFEVEVDGTLTTSKVTYDGKEVTARMPNNQIVRCGSKDVFRKALPVGFAESNNILEWEANALQPETFTLNAAIEIGWKKVGNAYVMATLEVVAAELEPAQ